MGEMQLPGVRATEGRAGWTEESTEQGEMQTGRTGPHLLGMEDCHLDIWEIRESGRGWWGGYPAGRGGL
jgi:hypothetical protein